MRGLERIVDWDDFDGVPLVSLSTNFRMLDIKRYIDISFPHIHLCLYNIVMRVHGLDEA